MSIIKGIVALIAAVFIALVAMLLVGFLTIAELAFKVIATFLLVAAFFYLAIRSWIQHLVGTKAKQDR